MITAYRAQDGKLEAAGSDLSDLSGLVWIDMHSPNVAEERAVEAALGLDIPTREDMQEIELSSRLYDERGALFLTAQVVAMPESHEPEIGPVTFVLTSDRLVTVRYHSPRSIAVFAGRATSQQIGCKDGKSTLAALLETLVDRLADILEAEARRLDHLNRSIFEAHRPGGKSQNLAVIVQRIGRAEDLNGKLAESLATIQRVLGFLSVPSGGAAPLVLKGFDKARLKTMMRDVKSLQETVATQERKILFHLDATLGVINIRQSDIIKIFSVVAFVFLPPTLIASVYGMNFRHMPELEWPWGYPMALGLMFLSALVPWLIFRWKKWL